MKLLALGRYLFLHRVNVVAGENDQTLALNRSDWF